MKPTDSQKTHTSPQVSVVAPLYDQRVITVEECLRSWVHNQTLSRERH